MKALRDTVGPGKAPHPDNLLIPGLKGFAQGLQRLEGRIQQLSGVEKKERDEFSCPALSDLSDEQQTTKLLFEVPDGG